MYALQEVKKSIVEETKALENEVQKAPEGKADLSFSGAFRMAKDLKKSPKETAEQLVSSMKKPAMVKEVKAEGPYVNFGLDYAFFSEKVLKEAVEENYGSSDLGKQRVVSIDYSSVNVAKPMHIGHLRSTIIGNSIYKMLDYTGFKPIGENYLGDWGLQFGKLLCAFKEWGNEKNLKKDPINYLTKLYVRFHDETNEELEKKAEEWLIKLEQKDEEAVSMWKNFRELSLKKFDEVYNRLGIHFDSVNGESFYMQFSDEIIKEALEKKVAVVEKEGTIVIPLEKHGLTNARLLDNSRTLYITRDLAAAKYRKQEYDFYKNLYVIASQQSLAMQQLFKALELMGYEWFKDCEHVKFGMVSMQEGKISTRSGQFIELNDVLDKAVEKAEKIIEEKNPSLVNKKEAAEVIGIGAVKFADLSQNRIKDIVFDWDKMVSFEGDTGPYLQYAYVRCKSILKKAGKGIPEFNSEKADEEKKMIMKIAEFPDAVQESALSYNPHVLANYLTDLAHDYSSFYEKCKVISSEQEAFRVKIVEATANVLKIGLSLLGIRVIEEM